MTASDDPWGHAELPSTAHAEAGTPGFPDPGWPHREGPLGSVRIPSVATPARRWHIRGSGSAVQPGVKGGTTVKFRVEREVLADAVTWVARGLPARPPVPVLAGVLVEADEEGSLTLSAFDYEVSAKVTVPAEVSEGGTVLVLGRLLADISRNLPAKPVDVTTDGSKVSVTCGSSRFSLMQMPADDYPTLPTAPEASGTIAGDVFTAFRRGAALARPWFTVRARPAPLVIASDALPVTASLYQAAKIAAATAPLVEESGTLVLVAQCPDGTGPIDVVNEAIFRIGVLPRLPASARLLLVSDLAPAVVSTTLLAHAPSLPDVLSRAPGRVVVVPRASQLICEASS